MPSRATRSHELHDVHVIPLQEPYANEMLKITSLTVVLYIYSHAQLTILRITKTAFHINQQLSKLTLDIFCAQSLEKGKSKRR